MFGVPDGSPFGNRRDSRSRVGAEPAADDDMALGSIKDAASEAPAARERDIAAVGEGFPQGGDRDCLICRDQTYGTKIGRNIT
jgi:hypothetical protein